MKTKYGTIYEDMKKAIESGEYKVGVAMHFKLIYVRINKFFK